jgi:hypothetical protein
MKRNIIYRAVLVLVIGFFSVGAWVSSSKSKATSSESKPCKESMQDCCQKEKNDKKSTGIDFENLSGKFFSSFSY